MNGEYSVSSHSFVKVSIVMIYVSIIIYCSIYDTRFVKHLPPSKLLIDYLLERKFENISVFLSYLISPPLLHVRRR